MHNTIRYRNILRLAGNYSCTVDLCDRQFVTICIGIIARWIKSDRAIFINHHSVIFGYWGIIHWITTTA